MNLKDKEIVLSALHGAIDDIEFVAQGGENEDAQRALDAVNNAIEIVENDIEQVRKALSIMEK